MSRTAAGKRRLPGTPPLRNRAHSEAPTLDCPCLRLPL